MISGFLLGVSLTLIYGYIKERIFMNKIKKAVNDTILKYTDGVDMSNMIRSEVRSATIKNMRSDTDE